MTGIAQGELLPSECLMTPADLEDYLNKGAPLVVTVKLTRNRVTMLSMNFSTPGLVRLRMHEEYLKAPMQIWEALREYIITRDRDKWNIAAAFTRHIPRQARFKANAQTQKLITTGTVHDLAAICADVNKQFFNGRILCQIGWGRERPALRRSCRSKHIRFGSWFAESRTIRIHPILDDFKVPAEFVRYIVFHEMLHAVVEPVMVRDQRRVHSAQFNALERSFPSRHEMRRLATQLVKDLL